MRDLRGLILHELQGFTPSDFSIEVLSLLKRMGIDDPVIFGGALRDQWMNIKISDYDVWGHMPAAFNEKLSATETVENITQAIKDTFTSPGHVQCKRIQRTADATENAVMEYQFLFKHRGCVVSLIIDDHPLPLEAKIRGDAPINTLVMNAEGRILVHPLFEQHAEEVVFEPYNHHDPEEDQKRFRKLKRKLPNLKFRWTSWLSLYQFYQPGRSL